MSSADPLMKYLGRKSLLKIKYFKLCLLVSVVAGDISRIDTFPLVKRRPIRRIDDVRDFQPQQARTSRQLPFNPFDLFNFIDGGRRRSQSGTTRKGHPLENILIIFTFSFTDSSSLGLRLLLATK